MRISDLLKKETMILDLHSTSKAEVLDELIEKLDQANTLNDKESFKQAILKREEQSTTGLGEGIAIPHAKTSAVKNPAIAFGRSQKGIDFEALDSQPSHLFFMIAASEGANNEHLATLSKLSTYLMDETFREHILKAQSIEEILDIIDLKEKEESEQDELTQENHQEQVFILGVTGCPTGIAHTFMAADALKKEAKERGYHIKVETNGSAGVKDKLTKEEIEKADGIIIAADQKLRWIVSTVSVLLSPLFRTALENLLT
ncbi:PTS system transporter subunit IIA [Bacillus sp. TS-2]|nr:PTS system transporter subunit IIA [Bacillus sp. TS-2]